MPGEGAELLPRRDVPKLDRLVETARHRAPPVGRERDRTDPTGMPGEGAELLSRRDVPKLERMVRTAGQRGSAVGRESDRIDRIGMPGESTDRLIVKQTPERASRLEFADGEAAKGNCADANTDTL